MVKFGDDSRPSDLEPRTAESAVQRVPHSVFTALSTRLTLRLSALIILIHPSPLHPLRRTPALNTFPLLMLVVQFPHQQLLIHFRMHYIYILLRRMVLSAFQKYLAQIIDYNSSFEYICTIFGINSILNLSKLNAVIHFVSSHLSELL